MNNKNVIITKEMQDMIDQDLAFICDDCHEFCNIADGGNVRRSDGLATLCYGCNEAFEDSCKENRDVINEIEDGIQFDYDMEHGNYASAEDDAVELEHEREAKHFAEQEDAAMLDFIYQIKSINENVTLKQIDEIKDLVRFDKLSIQEAVKEVVQ